MKIALLIVAAFLLFAALIWLLLQALILLRKRMVATGRIPKKEMEKYHLIKETPWQPTCRLKSHSLALFHLPFEPDEHEVIYLENEYDEKANQFIRQHKELIIRKFAEKGFSFTYLPDVSIPEEQLMDCLRYRNPSETDEDVRHQLELLPRKQPTNMLLDYMVFPRNRGKITASFMWLNGTYTDYQDGHRIPKTVFDYVTFDPQEALDKPELLIDEICHVVGMKQNFLGGIACTKKRNIESESPDSRFDYDIRQLLEEVREKVNTLRLKGVSDAIISRYVRPDDTPSRLLITHDLRIFLPDYQNREVRLEPLNKAVFLLFLRHEEGLFFKELSDHAQELAAIYQCVKQKRNDIDRLMLTQQPIERNIEKLTDPLSNSINEKCTRIKEAFLLLMHEDIASQYYINGPRSERKRIKLGRNMIEWEGGEK